MKESEITTSKIEHMLNILETRPWRLGFDGLLNYGGRRTIMQVERYRVQNCKIIGLEENCEQIARRHEGCKFEMRTQYTEIDGRRLYAGKTEQMEAEDRKV